MTEDYRQVTHDELGEVIKGGLDPEQVQIHGSGQMMQTPFTADVSYERHGVTFMLTLTVLED